VKAGIYLYQVLLEAVGPLPHLSRIIRIRGNHPKEGHVVIIRLRDSCAPVVLAAVIHDPGDQLTIQAGIDSGCQYWQRFPNEAPLSDYPKSSPQSSA
jgi:hypothetical protein